MSDALIVFTRYPEPGTVKTRLIPALGTQGAADLQRRMTLHTLRTADRCGVALEVLNQSPPHRGGVRGGVQRFPLEVRYDGGDAHRMGELFGHHRRYAPQGPGDLGDRMARAFADHFSAGADRVVLIGSDCPALAPHHLRLAFNTLRHRDLVLGPAHDGGYYLIALRKNTPVPFSDAVPLFAEVHWGTSQVLDQTLDAARRLNLTHQLLPTLTDVDTPQDLNEWHLHNRQLSVIVPTLNEESHIAQTLGRILEAPEVEVIVADGGSTDGTVEAARSMRVKVIEAPPGRATQMNAGARASTGGRLLFCHADTLLPREFETLITDALDDPCVALGAFSFALDAHRPSDRRIEAGANLRSRYLKLPYGDQALFLRRQTFDRLNGFTPMPRMEDYDLARRAARLGRVVTLDAPAITSPRKWRTRGSLRVTLEHQLAIARSALGL